MISRKVRFLLSLGFISISSGLFLNNPIMIISGLSVSFYAAVDWEFHNFKRKQILRLEVKREFEGGLTRPFMNTRIKVMVRVLNRSSRSFGYVRVLDNIPPGLDITGNNFAFFKLPGKTEAVFSYSITPKRSGSFNFPGISIYVADGNDLSSEQKFFPVHESIIVYPAIETFQSSRIKSMIAHRHAQLGFDSTFAGIRKYQPDDPLRVIEWKSSARTGKLMSREDERDKPINIVYFVDASSSMLLGRSGSSNLDLAAKVVASSAKMELENKNNVGLYIFTDKVETHLDPAFSKQKFYQILDSLSSTYKYARSDSLKNIDDKELLDTVHDYLKTTYPELYDQSRSNPIEIYKSIRRIMDLETERRPSREDLMSDLRRFSDFAGLHFTAKLTASNKGKALSDALTSVMHEIREKAIFIVFSDLTGFSSEELMNSFKLARRFHEVYVLSPTAIEFEKTEKIANNDFETTDEVAHRLLIDQYARERRDYVQQLNKIGIKVIDIEQIQSAAFILYQLFRAKRSALSWRTLR